jgi:hypothetical protein
LIRKSTITAVVAAAAAAIVALPLVASAAPAEHTIAKPRHYADREAKWYDNATGEISLSDAGAKITWTRWTQHQGDSPVDRNDKALRVVVRPPAADGSGYAKFSTDGSRNLDRSVGSMKNLSFDLATSTADNGGAPRITVEFLNGDVAYLASVTCKRVLTVDTRWSRADFTGAKHDCSFTVTGDTSGTYEADGERSAWQVYADAHPDQRVIATYMVWDVPGVYFTDHIALGGPWAYVVDDTHGVACSGMEARC